MESLEGEVFSDLQSDKKTAAKEYLTAVKS